MPPLERIAYALAFIAVVSAILILVLSLASSDAIRLIPPVDVGAILSHPLYLGGSLAIAYALAPLLAKWLPRKRDWQ